MCAITCDEAGGCNIFRIESGLCTFGFLAQASEDGATDDIDVFIKSIYRIFSMIQIIGLIMKYYFKMTNSHRRSDALKPFAGMELTQRWRLTGST